MLRYFINYETQPLVEVDITDSAVAGPNIIAMVRFWSGWEERLANAPNYEVAFCRQLALFLLENNRMPGEDDEGWYPLDGSHGIKAHSFYRHEFNEDLIEVS